MIRRLTAVFCLLSVISLYRTSDSYAQSDPSGQRRVTDLYAITNAQIVTSPGSDAFTGTILIKNGLISAVGKNVTIPKGAQVIKGDSLFIYPGFIDMGSQSGVKKPEEVKHPENLDPSNPPNEIAGISPESSVLDYWKAHEETMEWRKSGFTMVQLLPQGQMLPGNTALVILGDQSSNNIIRENTGLYAQFETHRGLYPGTTLGIMAKFRELYKNAELQSTHESQYGSDQDGIRRPELDHSLSAFYPVINKESPIIFRTEQALEIRRAIKLQEELGFGLTLFNVKETADLDAILKESSANLILSLDLPEDKAFKQDMEGATEEAKTSHKRVEEAYKKALSQAGQLEKADIKFAFTTYGVKKQEVLKNIQKMIENGLSTDAALEALTSTPARMLNIDKYSGSIASGKMANLVISDAPIFSKDAFIHYVMADGYLYEFDADKSKNGVKDADKIAGKWSYTSETPGGESQGEIRFEKKGENLTGEIDVDNPNGGGTITRELENISFDGKNLSFSFSIQVQGEELTVNTKGLVEGDKFDGSISIRDMGTYSLKAEKRPSTTF
ncbi:amidohydrolase family protein [Echinicola pacifica]|uniref:amidohydrolase family protein n=1 Tax=Echinicola pacifica TaxID=346377 RepID=UPI0005C7A13F|nr:amidohydrolase family protein [Echinicola pacifica]